MNSETCLQKFSPFNPSEADFIETVAVGVIKSVEKSDGKGGKTTKMSITILLSLLYQLKPSTDDTRCREGHQEEVNYSFSYNVQPHYVIALRSGALMMHLRSVSSLLHST